MIIMIINNNNDNNNTANEWIINHIFTHYSTFSGGKKRTTINTFCPSIYNFRKIDVHSYIHGEENTNKKKKIQTISLEEE